MSSWQAKETVKIAKSKLATAKKEKADSKTIKNLEKDLKNAYAVLATVEKAFKASQN